jgi:hypothetical protein
MRVGGRMWGHVCCSVLWSATHHRSKANVPSGSLNDELCEWALDLLVCWQVDVYGPTMQAAVQRVYSRVAPSEQSNANVGHVTSGRVTARQNAQQKGVEALHSIGHCIVTVHHTTRHVLQLCTRASVPKRGQHSLLQPPRPPIVATTSTRASRYSADSTTQECGCPRADQTWLRIASVGSMQTTGR